MEARVHYRRHRCYSRSVNRGSIQLEERSHFLLTNLAALRVEVDLAVSQDE